VGKGAAAGRHDVGMFDLLKTIPHPLGSDIEHLLGETNEAQLGDVQVEGRQRML